MAVQATPYVETALSHSAELFRRALQSDLPLGSAGGVVAATPAAPANLTARTAGCSDLVVSAPASGMSVNVNPGQIIVPGSLGSGASYGMGIGYGYPVITTNGASAPTISATALATQIQLTTQGSYYCYNDDSAGQVNLTISASNPTNPRIDVVIAQVQDAAYSGSSNNWQLAVVTGTPASSPTIPTLPASSIPLALVWVPANASSIIAADILDTRVTYNRNPFISRGYMSTSTAGVASANTLMPCKSVTTDITGSFSASTGLFTAPVAGLWQAKASIGATAAPATAGQMQILLEAPNGTVISYGTVSYFAASQTTFPAVSMGDDLPLTQGETVGLYLWCGTTAVTGWGVTSRTYLSLVLDSPA